MNFAMAALEYACTIEGDARRGVWVRAFVEDADWAVKDFRRWLEDHPGAVDTFWPVRTDPHEAMIDTMTLGTGILFVPDKNTE